MTEPAKRIRIIIGGLRLEAELKGSNTAGEVYAAGRCLRQYLGRRVLF
jgi:hypothetical protein